MSRLRRDIHARKLRSFLAIAEDQGFFLLAWAVRALQTDRIEEARPFVRFPPGAADASIASKWAIHPWRIETLLNELLVTEKARAFDRKPTRSVNCGLFDSLAVANDLLGRLENADDKLALERVHIFSEVHRLAQRQFEWQRGFWSVAQSYRSTFVYGGPKAQEFFQQSKGLSIADFGLACFCLHSYLMFRPAALLTLDTAEIGLSKEAFDSAVSVLAIDHQDARRMAARLRSKAGHVAYKPSVFRTNPCIVFDGRFIVAPFPELIALRSTQGLFYDFVGAPGEVRREAGDRFEIYRRELLAEMLPTGSVRPSQKYCLGKRQWDTPDLFIVENEKVSVIIECKARRLSYLARFSENPMAEAEDAYEEIIKGVTQVWRFTSHQRQGLVTGSPSLTENATGLILTLDTWLTSSRPLRDEVIKRARSAVESEAGIIPADLIPIAFASVDDLEETLRIATGDTLQSTVAAAATERFKGYLLPMVHRELFSDSEGDRDYPFSSRISEVIPWWDRFSDGIGS